MKLTPESTLGASFGSAGMAAPLSGAAMLRERADIGCLLLTSAVDTDATAVAASTAVGIDLPREAGKIRAGGRRLALWLSPRSWLVHCPIDEEIGLAARVNDAFPGKRLHAACLTDHFCWIELSGRGSSGLLKQGAFLSLEPGGLAVGHAKRTAVAGIAAILVHRGDNVWLVAVERSRARYFADWLIAGARSAAEIEPVLCALPEPALSLCP
jgi:heterotetrameric sarcosine oxidase gamma subunit